MPRSPSLLTRIRWRLGDLWEQQDAKLSVGALLLAALAVGGVAAARAVAHASAPAARAGIRVVTTRRETKVRLHGHLVTRWRTHKVYARAQTVMQTQTIRTKNGTRVVTRPVVRYRTAYRKRVVTVNGKTRTVLQPVTSSQTTTDTKTQVVTSTRNETSTQVTTVSQPVTVVETTTVVSTETDPVPVTITVTVPTLP